MMMLQIIFFLKLMILLNEGRNFKIIERDQLLHICIIPQKLSCSINMDIYYSGHFQALISLDSKM